MLDDLIKKILSDFKVELSDEFDMNFKRGAFFSQQWPSKKDGSQSLLTKTGKLRRSISARIVGNSIVFTSSEPYASIHNEGGDIIVTSKMKKYFWYMYGKTKNEGYRRMAMKKT